MSATNGSTFSLRSRSLVACLSVVLVVMGVFASVAGAHMGEKPKTAYVAIGDSLAFGYTQQKFEENFPAENPANFEGGYVNIVAAKLAGLEKKAGNILVTENLGCPGEISDGVIGHNEALGGGSGEEFNPCAWHNVDGFPTHTPYGSASQLEAAIGAVTGPVPVKLVTINIGSNDELKIVSMCENPAYDAEQGFKGGLFECIVVEAGPEAHFYPGGVFHHIIANTGDVIGVLRHFGYAGPVGILGFYNPQAELLPGSDALQKKLNEVFECAATSKAGKCHVEPKAGEKLEIAGEELLGPGVVYGNPFPIFNPQSKHEGEKICLYTEECNKHDKEVNYEKATGKKASEATEAEIQATPGDIHATPAGYAKLGKVLLTALLPFGI